MTNIEQKALALLNEVQGSTFTSLTRDSSAIEALCRAIEQHEALRQEVSEIASSALAMYARVGEGGCMTAQALHGLIIPAPKPDPLEEIIGELDDGTWGETKAEYADRLRAALEARGLTITTVEKD